MANTTKQTETDVDSLAWSIARKLARMHEHGRLAFKNRRGKNIPAKVARTQKSARARAYDGTGIALSEQDVRELHLSARAAILARLMETGAPDVALAWRAGARAARRELYMRTREPIFDTTAKAVSAHDRAYALRSQADFDADAREIDTLALLLPRACDDSIDTRALLLRAYWRTRQLIRAYYAKRVNYARKAKDRARDCVKLSTLARAILRGNVTRQAWREDTHAAENMRNFALRIASVRELAETPASAPKRTLPAFGRVTRTRTFELPDSPARIVARTQAGAYARPTLRTHLIARCKVPTPATREAIEALAHAFNVKP